MKLFAAVSLLLCQTLFAQVVLEGRVRDANSHRDIPGVNVYHTTSTIGVITDAAGRYRLELNADSVDRIRFEHISYDTLSFTINELMNMDEVFLQERVIPLRTVDVEATAAPLDINRDLPQTVSVLDAKNFEMRGYVDAGDLLRTEQSVQVEEVLSGKKTVSIRAGNPDEVIVMYNGVKMNSAYDNIFDLSLIDLEDVQRFEVIKGSNTALYGSDAFSGVINIVPKREQDYTLRLQQRFGTYASGNWGAHLYRNFGRAFGAYSYKRGAFERRFSGDDSGVLSNETAHQTATALLDISPNADGRDLLSVNYVRAELDYENARFQESLLNFNQLVSARYSGSRLIKDLSFTLGYQWLDETRFLVDNLSLLSRDLDNRSLSFNLDKSFTIGQADLLLGYQLEQTTLDFLDDRPTDAQQEGVESAELSQQRNGGVAIAKFRANTGSDYLHTANFNVSFRYDAVRDRQESVQLRRDSAMDSTGAFEENSWQEAMLKFSANLSGSRNDFAFDAFMNYGRNVKFPTLFQQISAPLADSTSFYSANLQPETSNGLEVGANFTWDTREHPAIYGVRLSGSFFRNTFSNKFVSLLTPASALVRYTNIKSAQISGAEAAVTFFLFRKKATVEAGTVFYSIPDLERLAFPFKYDQKHTLKLSIDHRGYSLQSLLFYEGEQLGFTRENPETFTGALQEITIESAFNMDVNIGKFFEVKGLKLILNASARNILNDDTQLEGLALRDRRFYLTLGAQM